MKKVLITGTKGLSKSVYDYLREHDFSAECMSVRGDNWRDISFLDYDALIHIAGVVPVEGISIEDYYVINTDKTKEIAEKAKAEGVGYFVYLSSMAVYGTEQSMDVSKGTVDIDTPCNPTSDYGKSKLMAEEKLQGLEDDTFRVVIIRTPSIYGKNKTEYLDQFKYLSNKLPVIPKCFVNLKKSAIYEDNLCELIRLLLENNKQGIVCPDDGTCSTVDFCTAIYPTKKMSRIAGICIELFLKNNDRIKDYYGAVCYSQELSKVFDGKYRVKSVAEGVKESYEK